MRTWCGTSIGGGGGGGGGGGMSPNTPTGGITGGKHASPAPRKGIPGIPLSPPCCSSSCL